MFYYVVCFNTFKFKCNLDTSSNLIKPDRFDHIPTVMTPPQRKVIKWFRSLGIIFILFNYCTYMYNLNYYMIIFYHANNACVLTVYIIYTLIFFPVMQTVYHPVNIAMRCCRTRPILGNVQVKIYENWLVIINDKAVIINELSTFWSNEKRLSLWIVIVDF